MKAKLLKHFKAPRNFYVETKPNYEISKPKRKNYNQQVNKMSLKANVGTAKYVLLNTF